MRAFLNDFGLFLLRVVFGATMTAHGVQSMFVNGGAKGVAFYDKVGIPNPEILFWVGTGTEILGGAALVLGLLTRIAAIGLAIVMGGAVYYVHLHNGFFAQTKGYEYALILGVIAIMFLFTGPGRLSFDHLLFGRGRKSIDTDNDTFVVQPGGLDATMMAPVAAAAITTPTPVPTNTTTTTTTNPSGPTGPTTL